MDLTYDNIIGTLRNERVVKKFLSRSGINLNVSQVLALATVDDAKGLPSITVLGEDIGVTACRATLIVDQLHQRGLLARTPGPGLTVRVDITEQGSRILDRLRSAASA